MWGNYDNDLTSTDKVAAVRKQFCYGIKLIKIENAVEIFETVKRFKLLNKTLVNVFQILDLS